MTSRSLPICVMGAVALGLAIWPDAIMAERKVLRHDPDAALLELDEPDRPGPVDYGYGPNAGKRGWKGVRAVRKAARKLARRATEPVAAIARTTLAPLVEGLDGELSEAPLKGAFGPTITMPLIPIHAAVLPDGRILSYGTTATGKQGAQFVYDIWDPELGTDAASHLVLPNTTAVDMFCSAQTLLAATGDVLITGGDQTVAGKRNYSNQQTELLRASTNVLEAGAPMAFKRWYPSLIALASGDVLVLGGRQDFGVPTSTPEVFKPGEGWRTLTAVADENAYGSVGNAWYYPRGFQAPNGNVFILTYAGRAYSLNVTGEGSLSRVIPTMPAGAGTPLLPTLMFQPGKLLSIRRDQRVVVVDINGAKPVVAPTANISQDRLWSNATVLADGKVLVTGGSAVANEAVDVAYHTEIWDPATGAWTRGAEAAVPRLYHSTALLLPDARVLVAGGGAPGPVKNLNAEIYYPPYLYAADGSPAVQPVILSAPTTARLGEPATVMVEEGVEITRVALVRTGSTTHAFNADQRFLPVGFTQRGVQITIDMPADPNVALPGYYMLFVIDRNGVPSAARIVQVPV